MKYNRIKKHYGAYNKELNWKITITAFLLKYIESKKDSFPQNLNWDTLLLIISLIEYKVLTYVKSKGKKGYVDITSKELKSWRYDYNQYLKFLIDIGIICKKNYSTSKQQSNSYRINYGEIYNLGKGSIDITTIDIPRNKNLNKLKECNTPKLNSCIHLTKWLDSGFEFDIENFKSLGFNIELNEYSYDNSLRILSYLHKIEGIKNKEIRYSRNQDKDNRLHSHLTNFPSKLRGYLTYKGFDIMSYDIKNSQPFSLIVFIEGYMKGNNRIINIYDKIYNKSIMSPKLLEILSDKGFQDDYKIIKEWVLKGNFYEEISRYLDIEFEDNLYKIYEFNEQSNSNKLITFDNKRDAVKKLTLRLLYSPHKKDFKVFRKFKQTFPNFWELLVILKSQTEHKNSYKLFPKLLQHIEADCLIDFVTKKISDDYPNTPIFTIHDSICTIDTGTDSIYRLMMKYLAEYTGGILPTIKLEFWGLPITHLKAA